MNVLLQTLYRRRGETLNFQAETVLEAMEEGGCSFSDLTAELADAGSNPALAALNGYQEQISQQLAPFSQLAAQNGSPRERNLLELEMQQVVNKTARMVANTRTAIRNLISDPDEISALIQKNILPAPDIPLPQQVCAAVEQAKGEIRRKMETFQFQIQSLKQTQLSSLAAAQRAIGRGNLGGAALALRCVANSDLDRSFDLGFGGLNTGIKITEKGIESTGVSIGLPFPEIAATIQGCLAPPTEEEA